MSDNLLDASKFIFCDLVYTKEFENILSKITLCYFMLRNSNTEIPFHDENEIRNILLNGYLKNSDIKKQINITEYLFDKETNEIHSKGRVDIRIMPINPFISDEAYYIIECKRLDNKACRGVSGLNYKYIDDGIQRFTTGYYSSYYNVNAMIGFIVDSLDIHKNIEDINFLLLNKFRNITTISALGKEGFIDNYEFHYRSIHLTNEKNELKLYHLMFSFVQ